MPLTKISKNFQITLPASLRRAFAVKEGDYLEVSVKNGGFLFRPVKIVQNPEKEKPAKQPA
ncbi:AbrB/MazE/SpoVT family DNA-binding domain-containing protein [Candidatus Shapirobacteria bacterium]|nr:AbrB/MazE/SpoVT family DNA-binding domain-containing protein [Candidatus Shapirobacteria bacterium]